LPFPITFGSWDAVKEQSVEIGNVPRAAKRLGNWADRDEASTASPTLARGVEHAGQAGRRNTVASTFEMGAKLENWVVPRKRVSEGQRL